MPTPAIARPGALEIPARILGIETSCDETAASVVIGGRAILSSQVASQVDLHAQYGGIFPEVASRQHILTIHPIITQALQQAHLAIDEIDAIAAKLIEYADALGLDLVVTTGGTGVAPRDLRLAGKWAAGLKVKGCSHTKLICPAPSSRIESEAEAGGLLDASCVVDQDHLVLRCRL